MRKEKNSWGMNGEKIEGRDVLNAIKWEHILYLVTLYKNDLNYITTR